MTPEEGDLAPADVIRPRWSRRRRWALGVAVVMLALLAALWLSRRPIAEGVVRRELNRRGVPASYRIAELGLGGQRLTDVVIGDPKDPDLVADWVELSTRVSLSGAEVTAVRAGAVRLRGRLVNGTVSFGSIDKLLPPPSGKPFALPRLDAEVADARMRLETPYGVVGLKLSGSGRLDDGFSGRLAAVSDQLTLADGCALQRLEASVAIRIEDARPSLAGPVRSAALACGGARLTGLATTLDVRLNDRLDRWQGSARLALAQAAGADARVRNVAGRVSFEGSARETAGQAALTAGRFSAAQLEGTRLALDGRYAAGRRQAFSGTARMSGARLPANAVRDIEAVASTGTGTPVGPLMAALARAAAAAGRKFDALAELAVTQGPEGGSLRVQRLTARAASGAEVVLAGQEGVALGWPDGGLTINGLLTTGGGGMPEAAIQLAQARPGGAVEGTAILRPYSAGGARLALQPVRFTRGRDGATRFDTRATLSGPIGDGRIDGLNLPLTGSWDGGSSVALNTGCAPIAWQRLAISGLVLDPARLTLCPTGAAWVRASRAGVAGGARTGATRLAGSLGGTPLSMQFGAGSLDLATLAFALRSVQTRLGAPERVSQFGVAELSGRIAGRNVGGTFAGGAGQIGNVPLLISDAGGDWRFAGGRLALDGGLRVADAQAGSPRFLPLTSDDFRLVLAGNAITAGGTLGHSDKRVEVTRVAITHDLGAGRGGATLAVPGIAFNDDFQPDELTPLTFGVVADVEGSISGEGRIDWSPDAVTSTGTFRTAGTNLAAAFGPVTGISGEIRFTDLLGMVTAPGQVATIAEVNPGIPVTDGLVRYRLLEGQRVQVEGGRWPLAGGEMVLEPTVLDFADHAERRMTFRVSGVNAALFLQEFAFENLNATGTFDGVLPMVFDAAGGRVVGGRLVARGGGNIAYVGEVTKEDVGFWGNLAFQALKSIDYRDLTIEMDGPLAGEMVTAIRFGGASQGEGTSSNFLIRRLARLPFVFNVRIKAPFRQLIDSVQSYYDPSRLIERNLPALMQDQQRQQPVTPPALGGGVQPTASEIVP